MKRFLAFICVLALVVSMCSAFSFAAEPEAGVTETSTIERRLPSRYKVKTATHMYVSGSYSSGYVFPGFVPAGAYVVYAGHTSGDFTYVMYNSYTGYIPSNLLTEQQ